MFNLREIIAFLNLSALYNIILRNKQLPITKAFQTRHQIFIETVKFNFTCSITKSGLFDSGDPERKEVD